MLCTLWGLRKLCCLPLNPTPLNADPQQSPPGVSPWRELSPTQQSRGEPSPAGAASVGCLWYTQFAAAASRLEGDRFTRRPWFRTATVIPQAQTGGPVTGTGLSAGCALANLPFFLVAPGGSRSPPHSAVKPACLEGWPCECHVRRN